MKRFTSTRSEKCRPRKLVPLHALEATDAAWLRDGVGFCPGCTEEFGDDGFDSVGAQCSVGSIEEVGMAKGVTTQVRTASTTATATAIPISQSRATRARRGSRWVSRSSGFLVIS